MFKFCKLIKRRFILWYYIQQFTTTKFIKIYKSTLDEVILINIIRNISITPKSSYN